MIGSGKKELDPKDAAGRLQPAGTILFSVVHINGVWLSNLHNGCPQGVLDDSHLLVLVEFCRYDETGRIINEGGQVDLFLGPVLPDGKVGTIFDIPLKEHTALGFLKSPCGSSLLCVKLHLAGAKAAAVKMPLKRAPADAAFWDDIFQF